MADEKNFENEEVKDEAVEEVTETAEVEETVEEAAETVEAAVDEGAEIAGDGEPAEAAEAAETAEAVGEEAEIAEDGEPADGEAVEAEEPEMTETEKAVAEALAKRDAEDAAKRERAKKRNTLIAIIAAAVIVVGGVITSGFVSTDSNGSLQINTYDGWLPKLTNKYNHQGYVDVTGNTLGDIVSQLGITKEEFLEMYDLPADMPASTSEMTIIYTMPASAYAEMLGGVDFDTMKEILNIPDTTEDGEEITGDMEWGKVEGEIAVGDYIGGEENLDSFIESYELEGDITIDTKWKEIRTAVDTYQKKQREEAAKATDEDEEMTVTSTADEDADEDTDTSEDTENADAEATSEAE